MLHAGDLKAHPSLVVSVTYVAFPEPEFRRVLNGLAGISLWSLIIGIFRFSDLPERATSVTYVTDNVPLALT